MGLPLGGGLGGGGYSHILAILVCAAGKYVVLKPFTLGYGLVIIGIGLY